MNRWTIWWGLTLGGFLSSCSGESVPRWDHVPQWLSEDVDTRPITDDTSWMVPPSSSTTPSKVFGTEAIPVVMVAAQEDEEKDDTDEVAREDSGEVEDEDSTVAEDSEPEIEKEAVSALEGLYGGEGRVPQNDRLVQFGYDVFESDLESAEDTVIRAPVDRRYTIGPGDQIRVSTWGGEENLYERTVDAEGLITLPDVGTVSVIGLTYAEMIERIREILFTEFKESTVHVDVSLGKLRDITVFLVGEVLRPGPHRISARATVIHALTRGGGLKPSGSLRRVRVSRGEGVVLVVDLYDYLLSGDRTNDLPLLEGDVIHVPPIGGTFALKGYVVRPGIYELPPNAPLSLEGALHLGGGTTPFSYDAVVQIESTDRESGERVVKDLGLDAQGSQALIQDGDAIFIGAVDLGVDNAVFLEGHVVRAGRFEWVDGMRVSDLLAHSGGLIHDTFLGKATLERVLGAAMTYDVGRSRHKAFTRRQTLRVNLADVLEEPGGEEDVILRPLDRLRLHSQEEIWGKPKVLIQGAVGEPGEYELTAGMRASDLVFAAGGFTDEAYLGEVELVRRRYGTDSEQFGVVHHTFDLERALGDRDVDPPLHNFDEIVVRSMREVRVRVRVDGEVPFPGTYSLPLGARIADLLRACGGILPRADLRGAVFTREQVRLRQEAELRELSRRSRREFERAAESIAMVGRTSEAYAAEVALERDSIWMEDLANVQATGRIISVRLDADLFPQSSSNLVLEDGDALQIPRINYTVMVMGEIYNPSAILWEGEREVEDYLDQVGGLTPDADEDRIYLVLADGTTLSSEQIGYSDLLDRVPGPGDAILVPEAPTERATWSQIRDFADVALMLGLASESFSYAVHPKRHH